LSTQQANEAVPQQLTGSRTRQAVKWPHLAATGERHIRLEEIESAGDRTLALESAAATSASWELRHREQPLERLGAELTLQARRYAGAKRVLDIIGSLVLAAVFSPLMLVIVLLLRKNGGPVIYRHWRVGRSGRTFECLKFRTMIPDADHVLPDLLEEDSKLKGEWVRNHKLRCDPRVTRLGRFLRRTSLDELPQLWNVIRGEMSLVGPRPVVRHELLRYGRSIPTYLSSKPGITGLWQVKGRNDTDYRRRVALDTYYVRRQSLLLDLYILLQTTRVVVGGRGAY
jgi:exopolysaccharide production protein ExoY